VGFRSLEGRRTKGQFFKDTKNGKSARDFWGRNPKRRKLRGMRKGLATNVTGTTLVLVPKE